MRIFKSYIEMDHAHQEDVNQFPILWMFGRKTKQELKEALKSINATSVNYSVIESPEHLIVKLMLPRFRVRP